MRTWEGEEDELAWKDKGKDMEKEEEEDGKTTGTETDQ